MYIYIHTYIHTYLHTYILTYIHTYVRTIVHTYIHTCRYIYIYIRIECGKAVNPQFYQQWVPLFTIPDWTFMALWSSRSVFFSPLISWDFYKCGKPNAINHAPFHQKKVV